MLESLRQLLKLQAVDDLIAVVDAELEKFPGERSTVADGIHSAKAAIAVAKELHASEEREERRLEAEMREQEAVMERLYAQSGQVSSTHAYEALQNELDAATRAGSEFETRALELMEAIDGARAELAKVEEACQQLEEAVPSKLATIGKRQQQFEAERAELSDRRGEAIMGIDKELLNRYERIAAKYWPAVIALPGTTCPHCQMVVPAQRVGEVKRCESVYSCDSCRRLLVSPSALEA